MTTDTHHAVQHALARHPAYSINNILGMHHPDANENVLKRKRDDDGKNQIIESQPFCIS